MQYYSLASGKIVVGSGSFTVSGETPTLIPDQVQAAIDYEAQEALYQTTFDTSVAANKAAVEAENDALLVGLTTAFGNNGFDSACTAALIKSIGIANDPATIQADVDAEYETQDIPLMGMHMNHITNWLFERSGNISKTSSGWLRQTAVSGNSDDQPLMMAYSGKLCRFTYIFKTWPSDNPLVDLHFYKAGVLVHTETVSSLCGVVTDMAIQVVMGEEISLRVSKQTSSGEKPNNLVVMLYQEIPQM